MRCYNVAMEFERSFRRLSAMKALLDTYCPLPNPTDRAQIAREIREAVRRCPRGTCQGGGIVELKHLLLVVYGPSVGQFKAAAKNA
jgi:hypothetical protein